MISDLLILPKYVLWSIVQYILASVSPKLRKMYNLLLLKLFYKCQLCIGK